MRTLFSKLFIIYIVVILLGFAGLIFGLMHFIEDYFYEQNLETMSVHAATFQQVIDESSTYLMPNQAFLSQEMSKLEGYSGSSVWLITDNGELYFNYQEETLDKLYSEIDFEEVQKVFEGETLIRESRYAAFDNQLTITMIQPISVMGKVRYALYINTEVAGLKDSARDIKSMAILAIFAAVLMVSLVTLYLTRNMQHTLKKFNAAIKYVSRGNYEYTLDTTRQDELGELAREFNAMSKELKNVDGMRRKFISDISHDLRSPLTSIRGFTQGMLDGTIPQESHPKYLEIVLNESLRLSRLTEDVLALSRLQSPDVELTLASFDIHQTLKGVLETFQGRLEEKHLSLRLDIGDAPQMVHGDMRQIERVISNLTDNGIKFADDGGLLEILTRTTEEKVTVSIRNTGAHIPTDQLSSIWMRFSKLDDSRGSVKGSSGLGLAIVKEIIELHGETVDVHSDEANGVTFSFTLKKFKEV